jgi:hypothetical protein
MQRTRDGLIKALPRPPAIDTQYPRTIELDRQTQA